MYKVLFCLCLFTRSNYELNYNEKLNTQMMQPLDLKHQYSCEKNLKDFYCPILIKKDVNTQKLIDLYFQLKDLITDEARYFLLKYKYSIKNQEDKNKYNYYHNKLKEKTKQINIFIKQNKIILDNFKNHIEFFEINLNVNFFENMYNYAQNSNKKKIIKKTIFVI